MAPPASGRDHGPPHCSDIGPHATPGIAGHPAQSAGFVDSKQYVGCGKPGTGAGQLQHTVPVFFTCPHCPVVASQEPMTITPPKKLHLICASAGAASKQVAPLGKTLSRLLCVRHGAVAG